MTGMVSMADADMDDGLDPAIVDAFIARWEASGGAERSNTQSFLNELCDLIGQPHPDPVQEANHLNDYVYERSVTRNHADGHTSTRFLDLYKRGHFVLEAKQSAKSGKSKVDAAQTELHGLEAGDRKTGTAKRGTNAWVTAMRKAREQAEAYAKDLPPEHGWPPFLIVCDVGYCFEIYADFSGQGKNYAHFPDRRSFRVLLEDLRSPVVRERLRAIWTDPHALDPAKKSAEVTRDIAARLAIVARDLEQKHDAETVAMFLMRCLFTMFAEDVDLLKRHSFTRMLEELQAMPDRAHLALEQLWTDMDTGSALNAWIREPVRKFNGGLFRDARALPLTAEMVAELTIAARRDWRDVEPAIFGTLLEQALDKKERHKLGAHYTPRAYVERLVTPTLIEPLRDDWRDVMVECQALIEDGKTDEALREARRFHESLCETRVLDPACGTGNFLYVAMEMMKKLEGDVVDFITELGGEATLEFQGHTVDPHQFLGIELNPRAAAIAELVLWIGFIKWQLKTGGQDVVRDPVLKDFHNIECRDAVLDYRERTLRLDDNGKPVSRWDGETMKAHPVTGENVPDESARVEIYDYADPKPAVWPKADFIVGNPPFIGKGGLRSDLGDGYTEALWAAHRDMPKSADFVMYWWNQAARLTAAAAKKGGGGQPRRFGFITTNSIRQTFNRRVIEKALSGKPPLSLIYAIPDHPWMKSADRAAVRISMTVAGPGEACDGKLETVVSESALHTDQPIVKVSGQVGAIRAQLKTGARVSAVVSLLANRALSWNGMMLAAAGFVLEPHQALRLSEVSEQAKGMIRPYKHGFELARRPVGRFVVDTFGYQDPREWSHSPELVQFLIENVKPQRDAARDKAFRENWWLFGRSRPTLRAALEDLPRYIATTETSKHRHFQFLDAKTVPDHMVVAIATSRGDVFSILASRVHCRWALAAGARLGVGNDPRYSKSRCFDPFPFPDLTDKPALKSRLGDLGERLDAHRKAVLDRHDFLTMTKLYNVLERVRALDAGKAGEPPLTDAERDIYDAGLVGTLKSIHDDIDAAVFEVYGWPADLDDEAILERLVALNLERHEEERRGQIRWLRPDFQIPRFAPKSAKGKQDDLDLGAAAVVETGAKLPALPAKDRRAQARIVRELLETATGPVTPDTLARRLSGKNTKAKINRVRDMLDVMEALGQAELDEEGRYFLAG